jgi:hypothetical protein
MYPGANQFYDEATMLFERLVTIYNYKLIDWTKGGGNITITYQNRHIEREIKIENNVGYTNYGFGVFITDLKTREYNLLYHVPWAKEDLKCDFLKRACEKIFNKKEILHLIEGKPWTRLKEYFHE